ncbi:hypothetical protein IDH44_00565 [Paenibacillus sp. IB182496]|uniref:Phenylacetate-CoA ligase n=1 Tax=Paenibacillus sabuli TaxID=2772509 RepID=A0A927BPP9_9BACL|nr:hypothetical protein [Paenibacillus sabuli]MBD2843666.1 hypothetical protein [Paenibacillus sabuli]
MIDPSALRLHLQRLIELHPGYERLIAEQHVQPEAASLAELPLLTAERLERCYYGQAARTDPGLHVYRTSGTSTGVRKAIYYSHGDEAHYRAAKAASYRDWLSANGLQTRRAFIDVGTGHAAATAEAIFAEMGMQTQTVSFALPIETHLAQLHAFRPDLLYTMPSILEAIARQTLRPELLGLCGMILVGELASPAWQVNMAVRFGLPEEAILDTYGSIEVGAIAAYSHACGAYVLADGLYAETVPAELLDPRYEPLEPGEGVLVLTSLERRLFPVVRYVTYDVVRGLRRIELDGKPRQIFSCLSKRIGHEFKHGEKISLYDIENVVHTLVPDAALRVGVRDNRLILRIRSAMLAPELLEDVRDAVEHRIEAIGQMIDNGMLERIEVLPAADDEPWGRGAVKSKKLYR